MASLAEKYPDKIRSMVREKGEGKYIVSLYSFKDGRWVDTEVTDRLAVKDGQLAIECGFIFSSCVTPTEASGKLAIGGLGPQKAIWPAMIHKATGRLVGSYKAMELGDSSFSLGMLTGCMPAYGIKLAPGDKQFAMKAYKKFTTNQPHDYSWDLEDEIYKQFSRDNLMSKLQELHNEGWVMTIILMDESHLISIINVKDGKVHIRDQADPSSREQGLLYSDVDKLISEYHDIILVNPAATRATGVANSSFLNGCSVQ
eukprot:gnl/TRDRNA2_/TRDRNA2_111754_c0_seq1.p1 gnl/TRDRNA2_/TRDRNA2_111754_c0~~gnl/TRDRNA2_/TRDRNA2_111754_c0_seq1.p1  ORF type:complete len:287 (-),score=37.90 gnl/TRDRNA2_/TRDRNA2_111754_c0_seq1:295-1065(-)